MVSHAEAVCVSVAAGTYRRSQWPTLCDIAKNGGANRDRTDDLKLAKLALSQLSYGPVAFESKGNEIVGGWWAWEDLNFRPHAYQARALTNRATSPMRLRPVTEPMLA